MTAPACGWAFNTGRERNLSATERLMLWAMAERTNPTRDGGKYLCWRSLTGFMEDTGLTRPTVVEAKRSLVSAGLIRITKDGQRDIMELLVGDALTGKKSVPVLVNPVYQSATPTGKKSTPVTGKKTPLELVKNRPSTGKKSALEPLKEPLKEPLERACARAAASGLEPEREDFQSKEEGGTPPPAPSPDRPSQDAAAPTPDSCAADPADRPVDPAHVREQVAGLVHELSMRAYPPGRAMPFTRNEQDDILRPRHRLGAKPLPPEILASMAHRRAFVGASP